MASLLKIPITETSNDLTKDIDAVSPLGIVQLLRQSDNQLFSGYLDVPSVYDEPILTVIQQIADVCVDLLKDPENNAIVMSGSGTSGRMAYLCARTFNNIMKSIGKAPCFHYLISGGDKSIIMSLELPEDDPILGASDLQNITANKKKVLFIGITCGLSAPYAFGQIDYAMHKDNFFTVVMGFNPIQFSRNVKIEKWHRTCYEVTQELAELAKTSGRHFIINPAVGPEPITGSSRMKGGSMTKVLLDIIFSKSISKLYLGKEIPTIPAIFSFETAYRTTYVQSSSISQVVTIGGECLRSNGHLYYVGPNPAGILGFIDASEMFDTYGEDYFAVRGFVEGGWATLSNTEGDLSSVGPSHEGEWLFRLSSDDFIKEVFPKLSSKDFVIFPFLVNGSEKFPIPNEDHPIIKIAHRVKSEKGVKTALVLVGKFDEISLRHENFDAVVQLKHSTFELIPNAPSVAEFSLKLVLNAITTGSCVQKGRVFGNMMINLGVSNNKLFFRTIGIISKLIGVDQETARMSLLKAIYDVDEVTPSITGAPISHHIETATPKHMILPISMLLASGKFQVKTAKEALSKEPIVRNIIKKFSAV